MPAALPSYPEWAWDMVRCGIILYGSGDLAEKMGMQPVMSLKTRVATIKDFAVGEPISYGRTYFTQRPSRIAVLPIGYADGLHRALSNQIEVLTPYGRAKQVGRICMDMCMIDVTDLPQVKSGDEVEIFGEHILCADDAALCDTIPYELMCAVSKRVPARLSLKRRVRRQEFAAALRKARGICPQHTMDWGQKDGESCEPPYKFRPRVGE